MLQAETFIYYLRMFLKLLLLEIREDNWILTKASLLKLAVLQRGCSYIRVILNLSC